MSNIRFNQLNDQQKGAIFLIVGTLLLFHTLGILQRWFDIILIIIALAMILYGLQETGLLSRLMRLIKKH